MANEKEVARGGSGGIGFIGLLTILFVGLKLTGYIAWSWWWVLSPIWLSISFVVVVLAVALIAMLIITALVQPPKPPKR